MSPKELVFQIVNYHRNIQQQFFFKVTNRNLVLRISLDLFKIVLTLLQGFLAFDKNSHGCLEGTDLFIIHYSSEVPLVLTEITLHPEKDHIRQESMQGAKKPC